MEEKKYLNEEKYLETKGKIKKIAFCILLCAILIGGTLITLGIINTIKSKNLSSEENIAKIQSNLDAEKAKLESKKVEIEARYNEKLNAEKEKLEAKKKELSDKGITFDAFTKYDEGEKYDLKIVSSALDPFIDHCLRDEYKNNELTKAYCSFKNKQDEDSKTIHIINQGLDSFGYCRLEDEVKNNVYTKEYCSLKQQLEDAQSPNNASSFASTKYYMIGGAVLLMGGMIALSLFMMTKQREISAYVAQSHMPVAKESVEEMAPSAGVAAKEIAKGIKEGLKEDEEKKK